MFTCSSSRPLYSVYVAADFQSNCIPWPPPHRTEMHGNQLRSTLTSSACTTAPFKGDVIIKSGTLVAWPEHGSIRLKSARACRRPILLILPFVLFARTAFT